MSLSALCAALSPVRAQVPATVVLREGQVPPGGDGSVVVTLDNPFSNGLGQVGFVGQLASGDHFLWRHDSVIWRGNSAVGRSLDTPSHFERQNMGLSDTGAFVYLPRVDGGGDGLWTQNGLFLLEGDPAPGYAMGEVISFLYRPTMLPSGRMYWIASIDANADGVSDGRALYTSPDSNLANVTVHLRSGDTVSGLSLDAFGIDFDYDVSADNAHYIVVVDLVTGSIVDDGGVVVDGVLVVQEDVTPTGTGASFDNFDLVAINNMGNHLISGDSDGPIESDEFLLYNGTIAIAEGDTIGGITLTPGATVQALSINNLNHAVHQWSFLGGEALFFSPDAANLAATSELVLAVGDTVDLDGNGTGDALVTDLNATSANGSGLNLGDDGQMFVNVDLDMDGDGVGDTVAILRFTATFCGDGVVGGAEACDDGGESAACNADCTPAVCGDGIFNSSAGEQCDDAGSASADCDLDCTLPLCGDGVANAAAGEECDAAGESADCDVDCTLAVCGDGTVNAGALEECDEAGLETANCDLDCTATVCGDSTRNLAAGEVCDDGGASATCDADCTPVYCGDGLANAAAGEACDAGGESADCDLDCTLPACGDGVFNQTAGEECEDGNTQGDDGCSAVCALEGPGESAPGDGGGCGCRTSPQDPSGSLVVILFVGLALTRVRRRVQSRLGPSGVSAT